MASATAGIFGLNKGDANVIVGNPALSYLTQAFQQDQQRKAREDADFQGQLAKINFDGAREADTDHLFKGYADIQNTFNKLRNTKDRTERNRLQQDIAIQQRNLLTAANLSKQTNANEAKYAQLRLDRNNDLKDDYGNQYTGLVKTSIFDPNYKAKAEYFNDPFIPQYDNNKLLGKVETMTMKPVEGKPYTKTIGDWKQLQRDDSKVIDENAAKALITQEAIQDPSLRRSIMYSYGKNGATPEEAMNKYIDAIMPALRAKNSTSTKVLGTQAPERPKTPSWLEAWNMRHFGSPNSPKADTTDGRDLFIQQIENGDKTATDGMVSEVIRAGGKVIPNKNGMEVVLPKIRTENVYKLDDNNKPTTEITGTKKVQDEQRIVIPRDGSEISKSKTNEVLNELGLFKDRRMYVKKDNPYKEPVKTETPSQSYKATNGKSYTHADLLKMGYTKEQIKQAISLGTLK